MDDPTTPKTGRQDAGAICTNCRFWHYRADIQQPGLHGECRRRAPRAVNMASGDVFTDWAETRAGDWCGDFQEVAPSER